MKQIRKSTVSHRLAYKRHVRVAAEEYFSRFLLQPDRMAEPWKNAVVGSPVLVRDISLEPSYWIVPVRRGRRVLGYIEVTLDFKAIGHAYFYTSPENLNACPSLVTRISGEEAVRQAKRALARYTGAHFSKPVFVHDEARGRLAWMIRVRRRGELVSRVFVTPGYVYERQAGVTRKPGVRGRT